MKNKTISKQDNQQKQSIIAIRLIAITAILLTTSTVSFAQFQWGLKLGANASTQSEIGDICADDDLRVGLNAGLFGKFRFNEWLALKSGIDYQTKGKICDLKNSAGKLETDLSYLILPIKTEFSASEKAGFKNGQRLFFATGPYLGYLLDARQTLNSTTTDLTKTKDLDLGWSFEIGMEFPAFNGSALQVSLNYDMGFSETAAASDMQNKSASLNLGILF